MSRARATFLWLLVVSVPAAGCDARDHDPGTAEESTLRYVALGDSYTIGTSVAEGERWPNQLDARIGELELVGNLAVNGYASSDVIGEQLPQLEPLRPEFISLLIGVNDVVRGVPDSQYAANVAVILEELLTHVSPEHVVCVATPDYTVTPQGEAYGDPAQQSDGIVRTNAILREACEGRGVRFVPDVFEISQRARDDESLVAEDGLHPSGAQYRLWVDAIAPVAEELVRD